MVDDLGRNLGREAQEIRRPGSFWNDGPTITPRQSPRRLVDVWAERSAHIRVRLWKVIETATNSSNGVLASKARERHVNAPPTGDIEKILRDEGPSWARPFDAVKYSIFNGLHEHQAVSDLEKLYPLFLNSVHAPR
jgi:hypothetical protein